MCAGPPVPTLFPYTTLFRSSAQAIARGFPGSDWSCRSRHRAPAARASGAVRSLQLSAITTTLARVRSEEHTSELQSHSELVCRLLLEKKKPHRTTTRR